MPANPLLPEGPALPIAPLLLTPRDAAKALAVCEKTLWTLTKRGELPAVKIGRAVRYRIDDLRAFCAAQVGASHE